MGDLGNFKEYKLAKESIDDLKQAKLVLEMAISGLERYRKYKPVYYAQLELRNNLEIITRYIDKCEQIIKDKA